MLLANWPAPPVELPIPVELPPGPVELPLGIPEVDAEDVEEADVAMVVDMDVEYDSCLFALRAKHQVSIWCMSPQYRHQTHPSPLVSVHAQLPHASPARVPRRHEPSA